MICNIWISTAKRGLAIISIALIAACGASMPVTVSSRDLPAAIEQLVNTSTPNAPGIIVALVQNDQPTLIRARGLANVVSNSPIDESTTFEAGSLAKPFTALGMMTLVSKGDVKLTDSARSYLPELPASWEGITIHHLLSHQSGISDYLNRLLRSQLDGKGNNALLQYFAANSTLDFTPGTRAVYSNGNYVVLAEIIERVSRQPFNTFMKTAVFERFNMPQSQFSESATSAALNFGVNSKPYGITLATKGPIGLITSISDLRTFMELAIFGNGIDSSIWMQMTKPQADFAPDSIYGYGLFVSRGDDSVTHGGRLDGYRSLLYARKSRGFAIAMLGNGGADTEALQRKILALVIGSLGGGG
jgi:D-alanyl-D-alanine carboxypeptidase